MALPELTDAQKRYAYKHCFMHGGWLRKDGSVICTECGQPFKAENLTKKMEAVCPHCGQRLKVDHSRKLKDVDSAGYLIITTCGEFQVLRFFFAERRVRVGNPCYYNIYEVVQHWIDAKGKDVVVSRPFNVTYYIYRFSSSQPMAIRDTHMRENMYNLGVRSVYCRRKVLPEVLRNGFDGDLHGCYAVDMFTRLLTDSMAETLIKAKQYHLLKWYFDHNYHFLQPYWPSVRICIRNGYTITKPQEWIDMVQAMIDLGYDVHSPHYVCPANIDKAHDRFVKMRDELRRKKEEEERRNEYAEKTAIYQKKKGRLLGLVISDGELELKPLQTVAEFNQEGEAMHHCVAGYYKLDNSLILSARIHGKRIETVEVSLTTLKVLQSRGVCNQNTEYHKRIMELVESNSDQIRKLMPRRKAKKERRAA